MFFSGDLGSDPDGPVVGLRTSGGEENFLRPDMKQPGQKVAAMVEGFTGGCSRTVEGTGVCEGFQRGAVYQFQNLGEGWSRGGVVQVNHKTPPF